MVNHLLRPACFRLLWLLTAVAVFGVGVARAELWISEVLLNPPGTDAPNEYVELRGTPNWILPAGTYLVAVNGDAANDPGTIQNVFDLSGRVVGGNGFLVLLQNSNSYSVHPLATALVNDSGEGFGNGGGSGVGHRGRSGATDLKNASVTFFLIQAVAEPDPGDDIDGNDDGVPGGANYAGWTIWDSVGLLDNDGAGDFGYGLINFRRDAAPGDGATVVAGNIVPVPFTANYVARNGNSTTWTSGAWVANGTVAGAAPAWELNATEVIPPALASAPLNHIGAPNFGAPNLPAVIVTESGGSTLLQEGSGTDTFTLALNAVPAGPVTVQVSATAPLQISTNGGTTFAASYTVVLNNTTARTITVRAPDDSVIGSWARALAVSNALTASADPAYLIGAPIPAVPVTVQENDLLLLNELKVNPPGTNDAPCEFVELLGVPNAFLTNLYLVVIDGNADADPGTATAVVPLGGAQLGPDGVLTILSPGHPYTLPVGSRTLLAAMFATAGGALNNGSMSFLLVNSSAAITQGSDLDAGDNGVLEGLPAGATVLDSVAWLDGDNNDLAYSPAVLGQSEGTPDAATRRPGNTNAHSAAAWINADLAGTLPATLTYETQGGSTNFPYGTLLTVAAVNKLAPVISALPPFSSVIGDPTRPLVSFTLFDPDTPAHLLVVTASCDTPTVVPNGGLVLGGSGANRTLAINPTNVGYAKITITVAGAALTGVATFDYAASEDLRGGGRFHTGVSDASAAMAIDAQFMLVGDDENQRLRLFSRSNSGAAIVEFDMNPFLGLEDYYDNGLPREVDIEGSTRVGNRIYWLGSHSHARDFETRTNRGRIFATDAVFNGTNTTLTYAGRYNFLKIDVLNWDMTNGHGKGSNYYGLLASGVSGVDPKEPSGAGFNFEGLAMAPGSSNIAYLAMRAPLVPPTNRSKALIIVVTNFATLAVCNATNPGVARFGAPIELNLGGRGIRSIEGGSNGYLIVTGPPGFATGTPPSDFRLFQWNGLAGGAPQELGANLTNLLPEAMVELPPGPWTSNSMVQLVSDNGITVYYNDGVQAKFLPVPQFKKFRSDWVKLGPAITSQPVIRSVQCSGSTCLLSWYSIAGRTYRVQWKAALGDVAWNNVTGDVLATDALASKSVSTGGTGQRFYRVIIP